MNGAATFAALEKSFFGLSLLHREFVAGNATSEVGKTAPALPFDNAARDILGLIRERVDLRHFRFINIRHIPFQEVQSSILQDVI